MSASTRRTFAGGLAALGGGACASVGGRVAAQPPYRVIARPDRDALGEGAIWSARRNAIVWVDIQNPAVSILDLRSGRVTRTPLPQMVTWIFERQGSDDFMVGLRKGVGRLRLDPVEITQIGAVEADLPNTRLNDAKVDPFGRIWFGTMGEGTPGGNGAFYRLDPDLTWTRVDTGYRVANGPTFSLDGRTVFHNDTPNRTVYAFDMDPRGGLSNKRVFIRFEREWGVPDGMTTDAEGGLWICGWDGHRVSRFRPDGSLDRFIAIPTQRPTTCVFAGPRLDRMFVASASAGLDNDTLAGSLFEVFPGVRGMRQTLFAG
jgi:xylono-1,5-lactonase